MFNSCMFAALPLEIDLETDVAAASVDSFARYDYAAERPLELDDPPVRPPPLDAEAQEALQAVYDHIRRDIEARTHSPTSGLWPSSAPFPSSGEIMIINAVKQNNPATTFHDFSRLPSPLQKAICEATRDKAAVPLFSITRGDVSGERWTHCESDGRWLPSYLIKNIGLDEIKDLIALQKTCRSLRDIVAPMVADKSKHFGINLVLDHEALCYNHDHQQHPDGFDYGKDIYDSFTEHLIKRAAFVEHETLHLGGPDFQSRAAYKAAQIALVQFCMTALAIRQRPFALRVYQPPVGYWQCDEVFNPATSWRTHTGRFFGFNLQAVKHVNGRLELSYSVGKKFQGNGVWNREACEAAMGHRMRAAATQF